MKNVVVNSEVENAEQVAEQVENAEQVAEAADAGDIRCKVVRILVEDFDDEDTIRLVVDSKVSGFIKQPDDTFIAQEVDYIRFRQSALTAQLCTVSPDFATYRSLQKERLSRKQLAVLLAQAKLVVNQRLVVAGEPIDESGTVKDHDIYVSNIKGVQFNKNVQAVFTQLTERVLFGALDL